MASIVKHRKIEELITKADEALGRKRYFEAERMALKALLMARQDNDFESMPSIIAPLHKARAQRWQQALKCKAITIITATVTEDMKIERGCYLIQPPQVGADARRLRLTALAGEVPVAVLCREPVTRLKQVPVVAISPGSTIRTRVDPPDDPSEPDMDWFVASVQALGDFAIDSLDPTLPPSRKVDVLLERLDALPEHENLHQALASACQEALQAQLIEKAAAANKSSKARVKSAIEGGDVVDQDAADSDDE